MKKILINCFIGCVVCSCNLGINKDFIPGTYVREVKNEFSMGRDTLLIGAVNEVTYSIIHKGSYQRIKNGKQLAVKNVVENWTAAYDENRKLLMESKRGKMISFDPSKNILFVGSSQYKKIK